MKRRPTVLRITRALRGISKTFYLDMRTVRTYVKAAIPWVVGVSLYMLNFGIFLSSMGCFVAYLAAGGWKFVWVVIRTLPRDLIALQRLLTVRWQMWKWMHNDYNVARIFKENADKNPTKTAFIFDDHIWTFQDVNTYCNCVANYFYNEGFRKGDIVAIYLDNRFEVIGLWLGLSKIGVISALMNYNLRGDQLMGCFLTCRARAIIFGTEKSEEIKGVAPQINGETRLYSIGPGSTDVPSLQLDNLFRASSSSEPPCVPVTLRDKLVLIFTSGTTGLPKAAIVTHTRYCYVSYGIRKALGIHGDDIIYDVLPLYHLSGSVLGAGQAIVGGSTVVLVKKFSASRYWSDCIKYHCTVGQYIGEICRYLLAQQDRPTDTQHQVRLMYGNGLRPELWQPFQDRFHVPRFGEVYGATEGNCNIVNLFNKRGAVGFTSRIMPSAYPVTLIRINKDTGEPLRDSHGLCVKAEPGEQGELVGKIIKNDPIRQFDGYVCQTATNKKIVRDVFCQGDMAFRTGDILEMDELGYMYFRDRTGDTFRWKGENVSTMEVEGIVSRILGHKDSVVYGASVFDADGKAGMAAIACQPSDIDFPSFETQLCNSLTSFARPVFLRFCRSIESTGTFKLRKIDLCKDGFDPRLISDPLFYYNTSHRRYEELTPLIYDQMLAGKIRL